MAAPTVIAAWRVPVQQARIAGVVGRRRRDHQHRIDARLAVRGAQRSLRCGQGWAGGLHPCTGHQCGTGGAGEQHQPRLDQHRCLAGAVTPARAAVLGHRPRPASGWPRRRTRGHRRTGGVPAVLVVRLQHRPGLHRRRRHDPEDVLRRATCSPGMARRYRSAALFCVYAMPEHSGRSTPCVDGGNLLTPCPNGAAVRRSAAHGRGRP